MKYTRAAATGIDKTGASRTIKAQAEVAELADAGDSKSPGVSPRVGSTPTFGTAPTGPFLPGPRVFYGTGRANTSHPALGTTMRRTSVAGSPW